MTNRIRLHSFGDFDRSSKVRWTAREIGLDIEEVRVKPGEQVSPGYRELNPYAQIPTCELDDEILIESTAICLVLAERYPEASLIPEPGPTREAFWQSAALATTSLEQPVVAFYLSSRGIIDAAWQGLVEGPVRKRLAVLARGLPTAGYLCGDFSLADIFTAYVLRIAMEAGLVDSDVRLTTYMDRLRQRPAAIDARFF